MDGTKLKTSVRYLVVLATALCLYVISCAPGPLWQDSGMYQYRIWHNDIEGKLGLALSHPLYHIIGIVVKQLPVGEFAHRINLISSVAGAFAVANLFLLLYLWLGRIPPAVVAAATLCLSWTMWRFASIAETYTLYCSLFLGELIMLLQYIRTGRISWLYWLGLLNGLAISVHMMALIPLACYFVFLAILLLQKRLKLKHIGITAGLWVVGASPYLYLIIKDCFSHGDFTATMASALFGDNWKGSVLNTSVTAKLVKENLICIAYNFSTFNGLFFFAGLYGIYKKSTERSFRNIIIALLVLFFVFAFRYTVPDRYSFFLPFYCVAAILIGLGMAKCTEHPKQMPIWLIVIFTFMPILVYAVTPIVAQKARKIPYRNDYVWFLQPWKTKCNGPSQFAKKVLDTVEKGSVVYADGTTVYSILLTQEVDDYGTDVKVVSFHPNRKNPVEFNKESVPELLATTSIYVVSPVKGYCPQWLLDEYEFEKAGVIWKIKNKRYQNQEKKIIELSTQNGTKLKARNKNVIP